MNSQDLDNLIRWAVDTDGEKFAQEIYGKKKRFKEDNIIDDYTRGKFRLMQDNLIMWIASLDYGNREILAQAINNNTTNETRRIK